MQDHVLTEELRFFKESVRQFMQTEVVPNESRWEKEGQVSREVWKKAGELGILGLSIPIEYGGLGLTDYRYHAIVQEEIGYNNVSSIGFGIQNDIVVPYLLKYCSEAQKQKYLPKVASGEWIGALAMSEPAAGSDLKGLKSVALKKDDHFILNGSKTFISNGIMCDFAVTAVKTDPEKGTKGFAILILDSTMDGFTKGTNLDKIGMKGQDTAELFFDNVKVPFDNLLGEDGKGFYYLMHNLPQERLSIAISAIGNLEAMLEWTTQYCKDRKAFGKPIGSFQNSRFALAEMNTEITIARTFVDQCIMELTEKKLTAEKAAMAKYWLSDLQCKVADQCLQLHGGYGYMNEYKIAKAWRDSRVQRIYGGTNEIMKEIIGRSMGL